jgi:hypothetical protein
VRLDHLLSKESTARVRSSFGSKLGKLLRRAPASRLAGTPRPRVASGRTWHHRGPAGSGHHCSVLREHATRAPWAARTELGSELADRRPRPSRPHVIGGARPRPLVENYRASTSIKNEELPSYKEPTVDALAPDADEGRGWLRKATGSCRPSAMTRGYPNGGTRLGSCPVTPA